MITEIVYNDRDNEINLLLKADDEAVDLSSVTKMELVVDDTTISSQDYPSAFDWTTPSTTGEVVLDLGGVGLEEGHYVVWLVVYDSANTDGIVWDKFHLVVREV